VRVMYNKEDTHYAYFMFTPYLSANTHAFNSQVLHLDDLQNQQEIMDSTLHHRNEQNHHRQCHVVDYW
jgi:hypothetical protein